MTTQLAIRLGDDLVGDLDWLVQRLHYDSRAEAIRDALGRLVDLERRRAIGDEIAAGYAATPQTSEEVATAEENLAASIEEEPWDKWW